MEKQTVKSETLQRYYIVQLKSGEQWLDIGAPFIDSYQAVMAARIATSIGYGMHRVDMRTDEKYNDEEHCFDYHEWVPGGIQQ